MENVRKDLAVRFIKDEGLPIRIPEVNTIDNYFLYALGVYEKDYRSLTKWEEFCNYLSENPKLDYLYETNTVVNKIVEDFKDNPDFIEFNESDLSKFAVDFERNANGKDIYKGNNSGKIFLSIDLSKANYQALHHVGVIKEDSYIEWLSKYTTVPSLLSSKHLRVSTFGKLNPKRQEAVEKYLVSKIVDLITKIDLPHSKEDYVSINKDEVVWEVDQRNLDCYSNLEGIVELIKRELGLDVKIQLFKLSAYQLIQDTSKSSFKVAPGKDAVITFFEKEDVISGKKSYHCIPARYHLLITKMFLDPNLSDASVCCLDKLFVNEDFISELSGRFKLVKL